MILRCSQVGKLLLDLCALPVVGQACIFAQLLSLAQAAPWPGCPPPPTSAGCWFTLQDGAIRVSDAVRQGRPKEGLRAGKSSFCMNARGRVLPGKWGESLASQKMGFVL